MEPEPDNLGVVGSLVYAVAVIDLSALALFWIVRFIHRAWNF